MREGDADRAREILFEAFIAGWQAGLAHKVTDPRARAVVEGCFDLWLAEALDEAELFGLVFRGREDLPPPAGRALLTSFGLRPSGEQAGLDGRGTAAVVPPQRTRRAAGRRERRQPDHRA
jgi:hypothetical protein